MLLDSAGGPAPCDRTLSETALQLYALTEAGTFHGCAWDESSGLLQPLTRADIGTRHRSIAVSPGGLWGVTTASVDHQYLQGASASAWVPLPSASIRSLAVWNHGSHTFVLGCGQITGLYVLARRSADIGPANVAWMRLVEGQFRSLAVTRGTLYASTVGEDVVRMPLRALLEPMVLSGVGFSAPWLPPMTACWQPAFKARGMSSFAVLDDESVAFGISEDGRLFSCGLFVPSEWRSVWLPIGFPRFVAVCAVVNPVNTVREEPSPPPREPPPPVREEPPPPPREMLPGEPAPPPREPPPPPREPPWARGTPQPQEVRWTVGQELHNTQPARAAPATVAPRPDDNPWRDPYEVVATDRKGRRGNDAPGEEGKKLRKAASDGKVVQVLQLLQAGGANAPLVDDKDGSGKTALHKAAEAGYRNVVELLLEFKADPNARDRDMWTPVDDAEYWSIKQSPMHMLDGGSDVRERCLAVLEILRAHGGTRFEPEVGHPCYRDVQSRRQKLEAVAAERGIPVPWEAVPGATRAALGSWAVPGPTLAAQGSWAWSPWSGASPSTTPAAGVASGPATGNGFARAEQNLRVSPLLVHPLVPPSVAQAAGQPPPPPWPPPGDSTLVRQPKEAPLLEVSPSSQRSREDRTPTPPRR